MTGNCESQTNAKTGSSYGTIKYSTGCELIIGASPYSGARPAASLEHAQYFYGYVANAAVYGTALTANQIEDPVLRDVPVRAFGGSDGKRAGQALAIVVIVMMLLIGFSVSLANQSNDQAPVAQQSVMHRLALQAAQAGIADYQDFIDESPLNAASFCSYSTFSCGQLRRTSLRERSRDGHDLGGTNAPTPSTWRTWFSSPRAQVHRCR